MNDIRTGRASKPSPVSAEVQAKLDKAKARLARPTASARSAAA